MWTASWLSPCTDTPLTPQDPAETTALIAGILSDALFWYGFLLSINYSKSSLNVIDNFLEPEALSIKLSHHRRKV